MGAKSPVSRVIGMPFSRPGPQNGLPPGPDAPWLCPFAPLGSGPGPNGQPCGAIVARSNGNSGKLITGSGSPRRSNSICRSVAVERIKGKRSNT